MCKIQCLLAFTALCGTYVHAWDIAVTTGGHLEFYSNKTETSREGVQFRDLTALAYDAIHNMLLFVDRQSDNASIFSYHLATKKYQSLVRKKPYENIQGLAFDPVTSMLFWTDTTESSIFWISLKPGFKNSAYGNLLIKLDNEIPRAIAVDSCRGYIYWTNTNITRPTIERIKFDGSGKQVVVNVDYMPVSIAVDQYTKKIYWADDKEGIHYSIESADLDGKNREKLLVGTYHQPNAISVSKDYIYWVDWAYKSVWQLPKQPAIREEPEQIASFHNEVPFGIATNYQIEDQTENIPECKALADLSHNKSEINDTFSIPADSGLFCVHGVKVDGKLQCICTPGYTGERCDVSVCTNYCFQGTCSFEEGNAMCRCNDGYIGTRCEVPIVVSTEAPATVAPVCNCSSVENASLSRRDTYPRESFSPSEDDMVATCDKEWDPVRDPIIMMLAILCGLLCLACAVLITKIMHLKRRPRIKKRIIVNKNVTPMTARPDQCEITIENCCNMNICETPCFEPRSTIRPTLLDAKPGKEERSNLIANMELPEDY